ncbi:LysR family transcriptional regulator [Ramlibacter sp. PS3R-8]|uniref:LysR family transcriptional regulator n=1 Tax=Ramlibacter sp. PS3R-8 TaxID=3133437 RepID=UPI003098BAA4
MPSNIDLHLLRCFQALLAEQHVSRAARHIGIAQPSMSHALGRLRAVFDDPLFVNAHGTMVPTARARSLAARVDEVVGKAELLLASTDRFDPRTATLDFSVMAAEYVEYVMLPPLMERLRSEAPGIRLRFRNADRERAFDLMERGEVDFRLAWWAEPASTLRFKALFNDSFVCVARRGHPAVRSGSISEAAFVDADHVVVQRTRSGLSYEALELAFARRNHTRKVVLHVQDALSLCNVVSQSDLLAALPERFAKRLGPVFGLQVLAIPLSVGMARQSLYWHERTHKLASHKWVRELLTSVAASV